MLETFQERFGQVDWIAQGAFDLPAWLVKLATEAGGKPAAMPVAAREEEFLASLPQTERALAARLLAVARASYALRDNDNLYLGKVRAGLLAAEQEARRRLLRKDSALLQTALAEASAPAALFATSQDVSAEAVTEQPVRQLARQLVGQPAAPGCAGGVARLLQGSADLREFRAGEVLVCDAIEPNMTFLVPLAAAIVERRGGMLIHGAIIAREYGIPCVTGIHAATQRIHSGDQVTVDGYLGIVSVEHREGEPNRPGPVDQGLQPQRHKAQTP